LQNAATRLDVVKSLQKLYESEEYISNLRHFTERFLSRFIEMATSDADRGVRVATIVLLDNLRQRELLEGEDIDNISLMIFDPESRIRRAVAGIFGSNVEVVYEETLEGIGGNVEKVEETLGNDKESADGVPYTWLKFNALVKELTKFDGLVEEVEKKGQDGESDKFPFKGFEFGEVESRIAMAASAIIPEMEELQVFHQSSLI
jgi:cohesin complex subunit SA-1/2